MERESHVIKLNFLSQAMERLSKSKTMEEVSSEIFDFIQSMIEYTMAIIYLIDYDKNQLVVLAARGSNINNLKKRIKFKIGQGVVGWVAREKKAVVLEDALQEKDIRVRQHFDVDPLIRSYIAVPLITSDHVIGILSISHSKPNLYGPKDVEIISIIASQAAALFEINKRFLRTKSFSDHILQSVNSGVMVINDKLEVIAFNQEAERITGFSADEILGKNIKQLPLKVSGDLWHIVETFKTDKIYTDVDTYILSKKGLQIPISISTSILKDENHIKIGAISVFRDMSRVKVLQEHIKRADRLAAFGRYVAGLVHEIRNPLLPIRTAASVLMSRPTLGEEDRKLIKIIHSESERLNAFMDNINQLAKPSELDNKGAGIGTELTAAINEIFPLVELKCKNHNISIEMNFNFARGKFFVRLSPGQIKQIFLNLFLNSIDAIGENGRISIKIDRAENMAKIIFSDTGCGIAEQDLEKIFEPFYSTKQDGTGLGLSIVHNIVHNAGGKIHVESEIKKGTRFIIILPCVREVKGDGPD